MDKPRRMVAKVGWHPTESYPRVGFILTNPSHPAVRVVAFYNRRGTTEQWIKESKSAIRWTLLSSHRLRHNAMRFQSHPLAYNLGNSMRTLAAPDAREKWSLTTLREKRIEVRFPDQHRRDLFLGADPRLLVALHRRPAGCHRPLSSGVQ